MKYKVVSNTDKNEMESFAEFLLQEDWKLQGDVSTFNKKTYLKTVLSLNFRTSN